MKAGFLNRVAPEGAKNSNLVTSPVSGYLGEDQNIGLRAEYNMLAQFLAIIQMAGNNELANIGKTIFITTIGTLSS